MRGAMSADLTLRPAGPADSRTCFGIFRASLYDLLRRLGYDARPGDADAAWPQYEALFGHLAETAGSWWLAEDGDGAAVGYARTTLRGSMVELTELFVRPDARISGAGRALLEHAFPVGWGEHRAIIATLDAPAVALYLRFGVRPQDTAVDIAGRPGRAEPGAGTDVEDADVDAVLALEEEVLGHARPEEVAFFARTRPGVVVRRGREPVGYAFLPDAAGDAGPIAARRAEDLPLLLAHVERAAHDQGIERLELTVPLGAGAAVDWLLTERRFRIDPFYTLLLADGPWARFDRYLPYNPSFVL
jgi:GNAT superfamily N-acetyltransferase